MPKSKNSKEPRKTIGMSTFQDELLIAKRIFRSLDPDDLFDDIQAQVKTVVESHNLSTSDPEKLYHHDRLNHQYEWPEHIRVAVDAFYALHQARRCIVGNDAKWAVYHMINALKHISHYNLLAFAPLITLGDNLVVAQSAGGKASAVTRKEQSAAKEKELVDTARKLLSDGVPEANLVGILRTRVGGGETSIRAKLKKNGLFKGPAGKRKGAR